MSLKAYVSAADQYLSDPTHERQRLRRHVGAAKHFSRRHARRQARVRLADHDYTPAPEPRKYAASARAYQRHRRLAELGGH